MNIENEILLTIVLPIYNVENYLRQAMESILKSKNVNDIEIILVDDGSTDSSGRIADEYICRANYVRVFHKVNGGLSDARNYGFFRASGNYVMFMDSDDILDTEFFDDAIEKLRIFDVDAILWDASLVNGRGEKINDKKKEAYFTHSGVEKNEVLSGSTLIEQQLEDHNDFVTTVWLGAYKREFIINNSLLFEKGILHEDELWTPKMLLLANKILYIPNRVYQYRIREDSIMTGNVKNRSKNISSLIYIFSTLYAYYDWKIPDGALKIKIKSNLSRRYLHKISEFNFYSYRSLTKRVDKCCIFNNARGIKDKFRSAILLLNGRLYCTLTKSRREEMLRGDIKNESIKNNT